jgi:hypothetical protein
MIRQHEINSLNNFISGFYNDDFTIVDKLIKYYNESEKSIGSFSGRDGELKIDPQKKECEQTYLTGQLRSDYLLNYLQPIADLYVQKYSMCNEQDAWGVIEDVNIQHYSLNCAYHVWHSERGTAAFPDSTRHLVFMTYLNDVSDSGETEFFYQRIKIKPEKGLTLIWPVEWMYTHRGLPSPSQEKLIVTGWYNFIKG